MGTGYRELQKLMAAGTVERGSNKLYGGLLHWASTKDMNSVTDPRTSVGDEYILNVDSEVAERIHEDPSKGFVTG